MSKEQKKIKLSKLEYDLSHEFSYEEIDEIVEEFPKEMTIEVSEEEFKSLNMNTKEGIKDYLDDLEDIPLSPCDFEFKID